jgi:zinc transport system ATP-binding protein
LKIASHPHNSSKSSASKSSASDSSASESSSSESSGKILIAADNISVRIQGKAILDNVSLNVHESEILTLIGPNGAGKSTLIKCLLGILPVSSGTITQSADLRLGYVPQKTQLNPSVPIHVEGFLDLAGSFKQHEIMQALALVKAEKLAKSPLQSVSGGEFQRIMLARAILRKPELLVLDEPGQGIDITGQQELYKLLGDIKKELGSAILMVSHDLHLVMSSTDRVICLNQHVCCSGHPESVSSDPAYLQLFGLEDGKGIAVYEHNHDHHHDVSGKVVKDD